MASSKRRMAESRGGTLRPFKRAKTSAASADTSATAAAGAAASSSRRPSRPPSSFSSSSSPPAAFTRAGRAALRKERRAARPHHAIIANANALYRVGFKHLTPAERRAKVAELLQQSAGAVPALLSKHDSSRVFQLMVKHGSPEQRSSMLQQVAGGLRALCVDHYGHHFVLKLLQYGTPATRAAVWSELRGHVASLAFHADGAVVFDFLYASERSRRTQRAMLLELAHPTLALDAQIAGQQRQHGDRATKASAGEAGREGGGEQQQLLLASLCVAQPALASSIVAHVSSLVERWQRKGMLQFRFVHAMLRQLLELPSLRTEARSDLLSSLCAAPALAALTGGADGVWVLSACVQRGAAKERKAVLRCIKADPLAVCRSARGHELLLAIAHCVDDTVAVDKHLWTPALSDPARAAAFMDDAHGAKVLLGALQPPLPSGAAQGAGEEEKVSPQRSGIRQPPVHARAPHPLTISEVAAAHRRPHHKGAERALPLRESAAQPPPSHLSSLPQH